MGELQMDGLRVGALHLDTLHVDTLDVDALHAEVRVRPQCQTGASAAGVALDYCARVWRAMLCVLLLCLLGCGGRKLPDPGNAPLPTAPPSPVSPPSRPPP